MLKITDLSTVNETHNYECINDQLINLSFCWNDKAQKLHTELMTNEDLDCVERMDMNTEVIKSLLIAIDREVSVFGFSGFTVFDSCEQVWSVCCEHPDFKQSFITVEEVTDY